MLDTHYGSELTIVLDEESTRGLVAPKDLLGQFALSTGVTKAQLFEMVFRCGKTTVRPLDTWQPRNTLSSRAAAFRMSLANHYKAGHQDAQKSRQQREQHRFEGVAAEIELDAFLADELGSSVTLPITVDNEWKGFIRLHDSTETVCADHIWERAELESLEQVARQLEERIARQQVDRIDNQEKFLSSIDDGFSH